MHQKVGDSNPSQRETKTKIKKSFFIVTKMLQYYLNTNPGNNRLSCDSRISTKVVLIFLNKCLSIVKFISEFANINNRYLRYMIYLLKVLYVELVVWIEPLCACKSANIFLCETRQQQSCTN